MAAPKGNQFYKLVKNWKNGAERKYQPGELWDAFVKYCEWIESNPIPEEKVFGTGFRTTVGKMRAMTIRGFCIHANIATKTFQEYDDTEAYRAITSRIRDIIFTQKFEGAASDMFNANIIARELALADNTNIKTEEVISFKGRLTPEQAAKVLGDMNNGNE